MLALIPYSRAPNMNRGELWDKLVYDKDAELDELRDNIGWNGLEQFKKRVLERLEDRMPYDKALKIFQEELENA